MRKNWIRLSELNNCLPIVGLVIHAAGQVNGALFSAASLKAKPSPIELNTQTELSTQIQAHLRPAARLRKFE